MREILFRGQDVDTKKWVYGGYSLYPHTRFPCKPTIYEVDEGCWHPVEVIPDTVGQYTSMKDVNGRKIFEGDIVRVECCGFVKATNGCVYFTDGIYMISHMRSALSLYAYLPYCEVIGNIHDNPELLKGGAKA